MSEVIRALAILLALGVPAHADVSPADAKRATELFEEGTKLSDGGKHGESCLKFEESFVLDPQLGAILNVAVCREKAGKLVEAYRLFERAVLEAARTGKEGREKFAFERLTAVATKVVRFKISGVDASLAGLTIKIDGRVLAPTDYAVQQVAMPSTIVIEAAAAGRAPARVEHAGRAGENVVIALPPFVLVPKPNETVDVVAMPTEIKPNRTPAYVVGGAGGVLLVGSVLVGLHAKSRYDDAFDAGDREAVSSAQTEANVGTVIGAVGIATIVVGAVLYFRAGKARVVAAPTGRDGATMSVVGAF
jgi:hypothetical protein